MYEENQKWEQFMRMMMILFCHLHDIFDADGVCDLAMMARLRSTLKSSLRHSAIFLASLCSSWYMLLVNAAVLRFQLH